MVCKKCGKEIPDDVKFCKFCGTEIESDFTKKKTNSEKSNSLSPLAKKLIIAGAVVVVAIVLILFLVDHNKKAEMPDVVGLTVAEAKEELNSIGVSECLVIEIKEDGQEVEIDGYLDDYLVVLEQNIEAGKTIKVKKDNVELKCSDLVEKYSKMLEGKKLDKAISIIEKEGYGAEFYIEEMEKSYTISEIQTEINDKKLPNDFSIESVDSLDYREKMIYPTIISDSLAEEEEDSEGSAASGFGKWSNVIKSIEIESVEDGVTYWAVQLKDGVDWNGDYYADQSDICQYAVKKCVSQTDSMKNDKNTCAVTGYKSNGDYAFCWGYPFGIDKYTLYDDDLRMWNYNVIDYEAWGI